MRTNYVSRLLPLSFTSNFTSEQPENHALSYQNVCDAQTFLLDNIFIRFGTRLYKQVVEFPIGTNYAPLVEDLFLFVMKGTL